MNKGTSWIIVGTDGRFLQGLSCQPLEIPDGKRLSVIDTIADHKKPFSMKKGSATGILSHVILDGREMTHVHVHSEINVVGSDLKDVLALRKRMLQLAGVKELNYYIPDLPVPSNLKGALDRLFWLIRWIRKG